jgi:hypothetical protein
MGSQLSVLRQLNAMGANFLLKNSKQWYPVHLVADNVEVLAFTITETDRQMRYFSDGGRGRITQITDVLAGPKN